MSFLWAICEINLWAHHAVVAVSSLWVGLLWAHRVSSLWSYNDTFVPHGEIFRWALCEHGVSLHLHWECLPIRMNVLQYSHANCKQNPKNNKTQFPVKNLSSQLTRCKLTWNLMANSFWSHSSASQRTRKKISQLWPSCESSVSLHLTLWACCDLFVRSTDELTKQW